MRKSAPISRLAAGFTLVEVMMATMILTVGFIGLIQAVTISSGMMDQARRISLATQILDHEIEQLRFLPWRASSGSNDILSLPVDPTSLAIDPQFDAARAALGDTQTGNEPIKFTASISASNTAGTSNRQVTIVVTWVVTSSRRDSSGNPVQFTYKRVNTAYLGNNGLNLTYQRS